MQKPLLNHDSSPSSSSSSSSSSTSQSHSPSPTRCTGLNLLVKAIHHVTAGSVVGVPYIQKRILTRRRKPLQFNNLILTTTELLSESKSKAKLKLKLKAKRQRRVNVTIPLKYRDSVLQQLTPKRRSERSIAVKIAGE